MAIHDDWARRTPYELFLPDDDFADERFGAIADEVAERGVDPTDPDRFMGLMATGQALGELRGPDEEAALIRQHALLLFHAWHFRRAGEPLWLLSTAAARLAVEASSGPGAGPPGKAGYLQLPRYLFWARETPESDPGPDARDGAEKGDAASAPAAIDGIFWTAGSERVSVLAVVGVRDDRPGFTVVPLSGLPLGDAPGWAGTAMRESGEDFRSDMPGAELDTLYEVRTAGELLKLLSRTWALADHDATPEAAPEGASDEASGPAPSRLPYHRISL